jgi:Domain of unknown function (DUF4158)
MLSAALKSLAKCEQQTGIAGLAERSRRKPLRVMQRDWTADELILHWTLQPSEQTLVGNKTGATRLGFAVLLKFFQFMGCFPQHAGEVPSAVVKHLAQQVGVPHERWPEYPWHGRTIEYHRAQIRFLLGFREATVSDGAALTVWLIEQVGPYGRHVEQLKMALLEQCRSQKIEPPTADRIERLVRSAIQHPGVSCGKADLHRVNPGRPNSGTFPGADR